MKKNNDDLTLFSEAMLTVKPLSKKHDNKINARILKKKTVSTVEHHFALKEHTPFESSSFDRLKSINADSQLTYQSNGISNPLFNRLKKGKIAYQAYLDLHEYTCKIAEKKIKKFIVHSCFEKLSCCLIIHGKGEGKLKALTNTMLLENNQVKAFHSAKAIHGGTGAVYVLFNIPF